jgi:hypothetical protein
MTHGEAATTPTTHREVATRSEHVSTLHSLRCLAEPNDRVQQRGRLQRLQTAESRNAGPVCCNGWFGPETLNVPDAP